ncbi:693_t:CDS:1, partial [Racocetra persica]
NTTEFYQQYQAIEDECKHFSQSTPYKIYPTAITTSKKIDTKSITERLQKLNIFEQDHDIKDLELNLFNSEELNTQEKKIRASVFSNRQFKRQLPLDSQVENNQGESKQSKVVENLEHQTETMKMDSQEQTSLQAQIQALPKSN